MKGRSDAVGGGRSVTHPGKMPNWDTNFVHQMYSQMHRFIITRFYVF